MKTRTKKDKLIQLKKVAQLYELYKLFETTQSKSFFSDAVYNNIKDNNDPAEAQRAEIADDLIRNGYQRVRHDSRIQPDAEIFVNNPQFMRDFGLIDHNRGLPRHRIRDIIADRSPHKSPQQIGIETNQFLRGDVQDIYKYSSVYFRNPAPQQNPPANIPVLQRHQQGNIQPPAASRPIPTRKRARGTPPSASKPFKQARGREEPASSSDIDGLSPIRPMEEPPTPRTPPVPIVRPQPTSTASAAPLPVTPLNRLRVASPFTGPSKKARFTGPPPPPPPGLLPGPSGPPPPPAGPSGSGPSYIRPSHGAKRQREYETPEIAKRIRPRETPATSSMGDITEFRDIFDSPSMEESNIAIEEMEEEADSPADREIIRELKQERLDHAIQIWQPPNRDLHYIIDKYHRLESELIEIYGNAVNDRTELLKIFKDDGLIDDDVLAEHAQRLQDEDEELKEFLTDLRLLIRELEGGQFNEDRVLSMEERYENLRITKEHDIFDANHLRRERNRDMAGNDPAKFFDENYTDVLNQKNDAGHYSQDEYKKFKKSLTAIRKVFVRKDGEHNIKPKPFLQPEYRSQGIL